jgi:hypothetical protein
LFPKKDKKRKKGNHSVTGKKGLMGLGLTGRLLLKTPEGGSL